MNINFQKNILAALEPLLDFIKRRAVKIPVNLGVFEELPLRNPRFELVDAQKIIFSAVDFAGTRLPGRGGNGIGDTGRFGEEFLANRALTRAARARNYYQ